MRRFIGRENELSQLEKLYNKDGFQLCIMYGRRRIGKSTLIKAFIKEKKSIYYLATINSTKNNIEKWGQEIIKETTNLPGVTLNSIDAIVDYLNQICKEQRIIVVLDELPYIANDNKEFLSVLQKAIDEKWKDTNMFLILCGSSISFMTDHVLSQKSPLFGRRTCQLDIQPFNYIDAAKFTPNYSLEEKAICFGITGGVAKYLELIDDTKTLDENIIDLFFSKTGYLYEETTNLLVQEFRNIATYNDIILEIAKGTNKLNEIADKSHIEDSTVLHAIKNLIKTGIIKKKTAITDETNKKKVLYAFKDNYFRFWHRFVPNGVNYIEMGEGEIYYDKVVKPYLHEFMGPVFEEMCRSYLIKLSSERKLDCFITQVGEWWGTNPKTKLSIDIDVVGIDTLSNQAVLGECKFRNSLVDKDVYEELLSKDGLIQKKYKTVKYIIFSLSGFSHWLMENKANNCELISIKDMYS